MYQVSQKKCSFRTGTFYLGHPVCFNTIYFLTPIFSQLVNLRKPIAFFTVLSQVHRLGGRSLETVIITLNEDNIY